MEMWTPTAAAPRAAGLEIHREFDKKAGRQSAGGPKCAASARADVELSKAN